MYYTSIPVDHKDILLLYFKSLTTIPYCLGLVDCGVFFSARILNANALSTRFYVGRYLTILIYYFNTLQYKYTIPANLTFLYIVLINVIFFSSSCCVSPTSTKTNREMNFFLKKVLLYNRSVPTIQYYYNYHTFTLV